MNAFEIRGYDGSRIKLDIAEVYGFPNQTCYYGGYEIRCKLEIQSGVYYAVTERYFSSTGALYDFYHQLLSCYTTLNGTASYRVQHSEDNLIFDVVFHSGSVIVKGQFRDNSMQNNYLNFEFTSNQSYFIETMGSLNRIILSYSNNSGIH